MSRSKQAVELCARLIDETYGELSSRIFTVLLRRGRLPISLLSRHTRLTPRQLRHGLAVLIQQNLIYHSIDPESDLTHYEANEHMAYRLIRSGKILEVVEARYGINAKDALRILMLSGHIRVGDLESAQEVQSSKPQGVANGTSTSNGIGQMNKANLGRSTDLLLGEIKRLLKLGIVEIVSDYMFLSPNDIYDKVEREILQQHFGGGVKGTKQKDDLTAKTKEKLRSLRSDHQEVMPKDKRYFHITNQTAGANGGQKRRRLSNDDELLYGDHDFLNDSTKLDPGIVIRVNYEKCTLLLRSQRLVVLAHERIGETTSVVYDYALRLLEHKISRCRVDPRTDVVDDLDDQPSFTTLQLTKILPSLVDAAQGIGKGETDVTRPERVHKLRSRALEAEVNWQAGIDEGDEEDHSINGHTTKLKNGEASDDDTDGHSDEIHAPRPTKRPKVTFEDELATPPKSNAPRDSGDRMMYVRSHLMLLAADQYTFLRNCGDNGFGEWTVDFDLVVEHLRNSQIDAMILDNFGENGHRLARMLRKMGRLDEKTLLNTAMMRQKDVRTSLAQMQMGGVVDIQEIAKDANRTAGRTLFFWFFDTDRVATIFLENLYKKMSRVLQRLDIERRKNADLLSITERSDVRDRPAEEYLAPDQLKQLAQWTATEDKMLTQVYRLDELVGIFQDY